MDNNTKIKLQTFDLNGKIGIAMYGVDDSDEKTWERKTIKFSKPYRIRSYKEAQEEYNRLNAMGLYEEVK